MNRAKPVVLLVDDEENVIRALRRQLRDDSFDLLFTTDPTEALAMVQQNDVAVIVCDFQMPGMTGDELLKAVENKKPACRRIMLSGATGRDVDNSPTTHELLHCDEFLAKPWDDAELKRAVCDAVESYGSNASVKVADDGVNPDN